MPIKSSQNRITRPPVVVVMGHIDHGKSTLLDYIRKSNIVAGEAGGITQHVGAYEAEHTGSDGRTHKLTFLDTPGHEAFGTIRTRGAQAADIAILVVSAEDGVKPQTLDAYKAIKAQNMPFIVAINKIDKPNADINRAKQSLGENEIYLEGWGGVIPNVAISALKGTGVSELLDMVILVAELAELTADPSKPAEGIVVESELDSRKGISATLLLKDGSLETGVFVVAGNAFAPVRFIENFRGERIEKATASMPVRINGWSKIPVAGASFTSVRSKKDAEKLVALALSALALSSSKSRSNSVTVSKSKPSSSPSTTNATDDQSDEPQIVVLPLIIKADVLGSLEGIKYELNKLKHDRVQIKIVSEGIGDINENDIKTALSDSEILVIGFNAPAEKKAAAIIERTPTLKVQNFSIIYELTGARRNQ